MKIALINGSPKVTGSASGALLEDVKGYVGEQAEVVEFGMHSPILSEEEIEELAKADSWVFACPLYVDGVPGHLLSCMVQLEEALTKREISVYGIVNCGFYEGIQAEFALDILRNWSLKTGLIWSGGIGIGGGGGLAMMPKMEPGRGPKAPIDKALMELSEVILKKEKQENKYVSIGFPRSMYKMGAHMGWRKMIKENGGTEKDLARRPEER